MNRILNMYSLFYYKMINIWVLFIIRVLIILKYFGDLDFECYINIYIYIYIYIERERERANFLKYGDLCSGGSRNFFQDVQYKTWICWVHRTSGASPHNSKAHDGLVLSCSARKVVSNSIRIRTTWGNRGCYLSSICVCVFLYQWEKNSSALCGTSEKEKKWGFFLWFKTHTRR